MSAHAVRLTWSLWAVTLALAVGEFVLYGLSASAKVSIGASRGQLQFLVGTSLVYSTVGALLASRRGGNPIGWLFLLVALCIESSLFCLNYAAFALVESPGALPGGEIAAWIQSWIGFPGLVLATTFLLLLFPTGRLLSRRWIPAAAAGLAATVLAFGFALETGPIEEFPSVENPLGVLSPNALSVFWLLLPIGALASAASLIVRFRRSRGDERLQLKWFVSAGALIATFLVVTFTGVPVPGGDALLAVALAGLPISTGIAIFKYRLYEIDVIVRRTLVYGSLSGLLAGLYFSIVLALQQASAPITRGSELAVAGSTLAVAALFRPARHRVQGLVDRRFYRSKVDAERTLAAFSARLRREIDLDQLSAELRQVVGETVQPAHLSLWLRNIEESR